MRIRLYRGPFNKKIYMVPDHYQIFVLEKLGKVSWADIDTTSPMTTLPVHRSVYRRTRHTHPDGSVFFEWDQPKGTHLR